MKKSWGVPAQHDKIKQVNLIVTGPFKISRNPIYVGLIAMAFGFQLALSSWMIFSIPFAIWYVYFVIQKEEILLLKIFGSQYEKYIKKVRRFL
jgi:protein-S-isoprenylcysteine O-methyltransferase Ste14